MKEPWSIKSRARECAKSGEAFQSGQKIRAAIFPDPESSGYLRKDYSIEAWEDRESEEDPFSCWLTTYEPPVTEEKAEDVVEAKAFVIQAIITHLMVLGTHVACIPDDSDPTHVKQGSTWSVQEVIDVKCLRDREAASSSLAGREAATKQAPGDVFTNRTRDEVMLWVLTEKGYASIETGPERRDRCLV